MIRVSRVGRKAMMLKVLMAWDRKHPDGALTTAKLAHAVGLKSSSNVVAMLREMARDERVIEVQIAPTYNGKCCVRAWSLAKWYNEPLPDRFITIGGVNVNWSTGEVIENVAI